VLVNRKTIAEKIGERAGFTASSLLFFLILNLITNYFYGSWGRGVYISVGLVVLMVIAYTLDLKYKKWVW
jgi:hypothetical protein